MYCDTKAEWMVTALGCFKFNYTLVTIYTNLGEDGVVYGIDQTQSNYVCTSQELLPKLIKVLDKVNIFDRDYQPVAQKMCWLTFFTRLKEMMYAKFEHRNGSL